MKIVAKNPGGAKENQLKSCRPSETWYDDSWGWVLDSQRIFKVSSACLINLHHSIDGNFPSHVLRPTIVCFLKVYIACYAALIRWLRG